MGELRQLNEQNKLAVWAERVTECRNSGQSVLAWCKEHGICSQTKVCGRTAFGPARKDLGAGGDLPFPGYDVQLGDPVCPDLAETTVPAYEKDPFGVFRSSCR